MERMYDKSFMFIFITISSLAVSSTETEVPPPCLFVCLPDVINSKTTKRISIRFSPIDGVIHEEGLAQSNCEVQSGLPPDPATGCCGKDVSGVQRVEDLQDLSTRNDYRRSSNKSASFEDGIMPSRRISEGTETELKQFPWIVYVETLFNPADGSSGLTCGGSLISSRYVLTAAHCIHNDSLTMNSTRVTLGQYNLKTFPKDCKYVMGEEQCVENILIYVDEAIYHPNYYRDYLYHDIALLRLREHAPYTDFIRPICLPTFDIDQPEFANLPLQIAGWGRTDPQEMEMVSIIKRQGVVKLVPNNECRKIYSSVDAFPVIRSQLCTVGRNGEEGCTGDSGGPLMLLYKGTYYLVGIISGKTLKASPKCHSSLPHIYTNVYQFQAWINMHLKRI